MTEMNNQHFNTFYLCGETIPAGSSPGFSKPAGQVLTCGFKRLLQHFILCLLH